MSARFWPVPGPTIVWVAACIAIGVAGRLLPHPPNVSPVLAISLLCGAALHTRLCAAAIPLTVLALSDLVLGGYDPRIMVCVYVGLVAPVLAGPLLRDTRWMPRLAVCALAGSSFFFVVSNAAVFVFSGAYPISLAGMVACYVAALPFYVNGLVGDLLWCVVFAVLARACGIRALG